MGKSPLLPLILPSLTLLERSQENGKRSYRYRVQFANNIVLCIGETTDSHDV